jgi:ion channel POLLUX/CASTOR
MTQITFAKRLKYWFDNSLSGGTASLIGWLAAITLAIILITATILVVTGLKPEEEADAADPVVAEKTIDKDIADDSAITADDLEAAKDEIAKEETPKEPEPYSFPEAMWQSLMHSIDAGTVAGDNGWKYRGLMFLVTLGGLFIVGSLISILSSGLESKLEELRKGRSFVCEENHTLILGWSSRIFLVISELAAANENAKKPRVVILSDKDKVEMEDEIRGQIEDTGRTKVVCRSGSPIDLNDLEIVNPHATKSIIILSPEEFSDPDAQVIKMILAITNNPNRRAEPYHIVAEIRDPKNVAVAKMVGKDEVEIVLPDDLIARITVQTSRQTGLSIVYKELLDFGGDEIYFKNEPSLAGKSYGEALSVFQDCSIIGVQSKSGIKINPSNDTKINSGDKVIVIAADDDKIRAYGTSNVEESAIVRNVSTPNKPTRDLILGWNSKAETIIRETDNYAAKGSELVVVADLDDARDTVESISSEMKNLSISFKSGDTSDRETLDSLDLTSYQHVILLCYGDNLELQEADSKTLMTLLHLRDIESIKGEAYSIVSEMLDVKNRALAEIAKADDFIVSDELAGLLLTQIAENKQLGVVFDDLFDADGSEIYLRPASDYVSLEKSINYYTVVESAKRRNETAIGYRLLKDSENAEKGYGVRVNPNKSENVIFSAADKVIVLAEG